MAAAGAGARLLQGPAWRMKPEVPALAVERKVAGTGTGLVVRQHA